MPAKGSTFDNDLLKLIFNGIPISGLALNDSSGTNLYVSLHTASPLANGTQSTNEAGYSNYQRVAVPRGSWTVVGASVSPTSTISFPQCNGGGSETETYFAIGTSFSTSGKILYFGSITPSITVSNGVTPQLTTASTVTEQ